jgi:hypothetical protein
LFTKIIPASSRSAPFDVRLHYTDRHRLPENVERNWD